MVQPTEATRKRYKLRVFFVGDDFYDKNDRVSPYRSFLMFAGPEESIGALRKMVEKQFAVMYPQVGFNEVSHLSDSLLSDIPEHYLVSDVFDDCRDVYAKMQGLCVPTEHPIISPTQSKAGDRPQITVGLKRKRYMPATIGSSPALIPHLDSLALPQTSTPSKDGISRISDPASAACHKRLRVGSAEQVADRSAYMNLSSSEAPSVNDGIGPNGRSSLTVVEATKKKSEHDSNADAEPSVEKPAPTAHENVASNNGSGSAVAVSSKPAANVAEIAVAESSDDMTEKTFVAESVPTVESRPKRLSQREAAKPGQVAASSSETSSNDRRRSLDVKKKAQSIKDRRASSHAEMSASKATLRTRRSTNSSKSVEIVQDSSESDSDSDSESDDETLESGAKNNGASSDMSKDAPPATKTSPGALSAEVSATVTETDNDEDEEEEEDDDSDDDDESNDEHSEADTSNLIDIEASVASGSDEEGDEDEEDEESEDDSEQEEEEEIEEPTSSAQSTRSVANRRSIESDSDSSGDEEPSAEPDDASTAKPTDEVLPISDSSSSEDDGEAMNEVSESTSPSSSVKAIPSTEQPAAADRVKENDADDSSDSDSSVTDSSDPDSSDTESSEDDSQHGKNSKREAKQANAGTSAKSRGPRFAGAGRNEDGQSKPSPVVAQSPSRKGQSSAALASKVKTPPRNGVSADNAAGIPDTPNTMRRKRMLRKVAATESDDDNSDSDDGSDSPPRKLASLPHLGTPAPGRKRGVMDMVSDRNSRAGKDGIHIKSISQMASAKPYDSLRKQIIKSAVKQTQETATGSAGQSGSASAAGNDKKAAQDDSASDSSSDAYSDSDSDSSDLSDEFTTTAKRGGGGGSSGKATMSTPMPTRKPHNNIRFAGDGQLSNSARARRKRSSLLSL
ncbi:hypothetical protein LPJ53_005196 [Coemansia erecta]|uniref:Nucleolar protein Dnt1-like N-terminal domain-containing protein n=1 Tax=Coemansia erecta TaxID=147472 RepID=A0A9W7XXE1_9FUNG|nr:hypothetical protein LPJ53_005196 [Coemansia erecta]